MSATRARLLLDEIEHQARDIDRFVRDAHAGYRSKDTALDRIDEQLPGIIKRLSLLREALREDVSA